MTSEENELPESAAASSDEDPFRTSLDATRPFAPTDYQPPLPPPGSVNGHSSAAAAPAAELSSPPAPGAVPIEHTQPPVADGGSPGEPVGPVAVETSEEPEPAKPQHRTGAVVREIVETIVLAAVIFLGVRAIVQNFKVEGSSMYSSFLDGEYMLVNKAVYTRIDLSLVHKVLPFVNPGKNPEHYLFHGPQRGDVIVFVPPPAAGQPGKDFIKRVIGVPGDTIDFRDSHVFVNGEQVVEPYITAPTVCQGGQFCHVQLQQNQFFVMGDNRGNSSDSRFWGPVSGDKIIGKALLSYFCDGTQCKGHFDHVGLSPNHSPVLTPQGTKPGP